MGLLARIGGVLTSIPPPAPRQNWLDNSNFVINQRAYATGATLSASGADAFGFDRWKYPTGNSGTITYAALANGSVSVTPSGALTQIVPGYRVNSTVAIVSWLGSANFISIGGVNYSGIPITIGPDTRKYAYVTGLTIGNNLTVALAGGQTFSEIMLEGVPAAGYPVGPYQRVRLSVELQECERYYQSSYPPGSAPGAKVASPYSFIFSSGATVGVTYTGHINIPFQPTMRAAPTVLFYSPSSGASGKAYDSVATAADVTPTVTSAASATGVAISVTASAAKTSANMSAHFTASADL